MQELFNIADEKCAMEFQRFPVLTTAMRNKYVYFRLKTGITVTMKQQTKTKHVHKTDRNLSVNVHDNNNNNNKLNKSHLMALITVKQGIKSIQTQYDQVNHITMVTL